jgi:hypothetical protein
MAYRLLGVVLIIISWICSISQAWRIYLGREFGGTSRVSEEFVPLHGMDNSR